MRKITQEEYIAMARAIHGDKYDYSLTDYQGMDKDVTIICPIHGPFVQNAHRHTCKSKSSGCPKCGHKSHTTEEMIAKFREVHGDKDQYPDYEYKPNHTPFKIITPEYGEVWMTAFRYLHWKRGTPRNEYTEEEIIVKASECDSVTEFQSKYPNETAYAYRNNLIEKCHQVFKPYTKKKHTENDYVIYVYEDLDNKAVYVGLTYKLNGRHNKHKSVKVSEDGRLLCDTVGEYFTSIGLPVPPPTVKMRNLSQEEAKWAEGYYCNLYKENGWKVLNKAKTGVYSSSVGGTFEKNTYEVCFKAALDCTCQEDMRQKYPVLLEKARAKGWLQSYTWFTYRDHSSNRKNILQYTKNGKLIAKWDWVMDAIEHLKSLDKDNKHKYSEKHIRSVCAGNKKSAYGYVWRYEK